MLLVRAYAHARTCDEQSHVSFTGEGAPSLAADDYETSDQIFTFSTALWRLRPHGCDASSYGTHDMGNARAHANR